MIPTTQLLSINRTFSRVIRNLRHTRDTFATRLFANHITRLEELVEKAKLAIFMSYFLAFVFILVLNDFNV